jgi:hypothetical protein
MVQQQRTKRKVGGWLMVTVLIIGLPVCLVWREYQLHRLNHALIAAIRSRKNATATVIGFVDANVFARKRRSVLVVSKTTTLVAVALYTVFCRAYGLYLLRMASCVGRRHNRDTPYSTR